LGTPLRGSKRGQLGVFTLTECQGRKRGRKAGYFPARGGVTGHPGVLPQVTGLGWPYRRRTVLSAGLASRRREQITGNREKKKDEDLEDATPLGGKANAAITGCQKGERGNEKKIKTGDL